MISDDTRRNGGRVLKQHRRDTKARRGGHQATRCHKGRAMTAVVISA